MQKVPNSSGGNLKGWFNGMNWNLQGRPDETAPGGKKKPCSIMDVSKVEHGYDLSRLITSINRVLNAGFSPKIAVIPTP